MYTIEGIKLHKLNFKLIEEEPTDSLQIGVQANFSFDLDKENNKLRIFSNFHFGKENLPFELETLIVLTLKFNQLPTIEELTSIIQDEGPNILFPYQRELISSTIKKSLDISVYLPYYPRLKKSEDRQKHFNDIQAKLKKILESSFTEE